MQAAGPGKDMRARLQMAADTRSHLHKSKTGRARKLLFYTHALVGGGAERVWAALATGLYERGYDVVFVQDFVAPENQNHIHPDIPVHTLGRGHLKATRRLARLLRKERPDVAFSAVGGSNVKLMSALAVARAPTKAVIAYHGDQEWRTGFMSFLAFAGLPLMSRLAVRTITVSGGMVGSLTHTWLASKSRTQCIHNPIFYPADTRAPSRQELTARDDIILAAGRLSREKGFLDLIRAFAKLDRPAAKLQIIGEGPQRSQLEAEIERLGLGKRVELSGYVSEPWPYYRNAKCFVLSSSIESFGNVIVEAMAHGLPIVSTDCMGPRETLEDGKFGEIVAVGDEPALAAAMEAALANSGDPERQHNRAKEFSFAVGIPAYEELIDEILR